MRMTGILAAAVLLVACGGGDTGQTEETAPAPAPAPVAAAPDTTEAALWAHLQSAGYRNWRMWPGKNALYTGGEPHGMLLTTYVNDLAHDALTNGAVTMPAGAIIVKENYMPDSTLAAVTAMSKTPGYDAQGGDWFWGKWDPNGVVDVSGRAEMCRACHSANAAGDFLLTAR